MRILFILLFALLSGNTVSAQEIPAEYYKVVMGGAVKQIKKVLGESLYTKYIRIDSMDSRFVRTVEYTGDIARSFTLGRTKCFQAVFFVIQARDTVGYINMYVNGEGTVLNDWREPLASGKPEILLAYKKLLSNQFKLSYQKALALGRQKGFTDVLMLDAITDYENTTVGKNDYIKVKYLWTFYQNDRNKGNSILLINAETGKVEKQEIYSSIPYQ